MLCWQGTGFGILLFVTVARVQANDGECEQEDKPVLTLGNRVSHKYSEPL